jgi:hypothetical protein
VKMDANGQQQSQATYRAHANLENGKLDIISIGSYIHDVAFGVVREICNTTSVKGAKQQPS